MFKLNYLGIFRPSTSICIEICIFWHKNSTCCCKKLVNTFELMVINIEPIKGPIEILLGTRRGWNSN